MSHSPISDPITDRSEFYHTDICHTCHPVHVQEMIRIHQLWQDTKTELNALQSKYTVLVDQWNEHTHTNESNTKKLIQSYQQQIDYTSNQLNTMKQQYNTLQQQYNTLQSNTTANVNNNNKYQSLYTEQININTTMAIRIRELESVIDTIQSEQTNSNKSDISTVLLHERVNSVTADVNELIQHITNEQSRCERYKNRLFQLQQQYDQLKSEQANQIVTHTSNSPQSNQFNGTSNLPHDIQLYTDNVINHSSVPYHNDAVKQYVVELNNKWRHYIQQRIKQLNKQHSTQLHELQRKLDYRSSYNEIMDHARAVRYSRQYNITRQQHMKCKHMNHANINELSLATIDSLTQQIEQLEFQLHGQQQDIHHEQKPPDMVQPNIHHLSQSVNSMVSSLTDTIWSISNEFCDTLVDKSMIPVEQIDDICNEYLDKVEQCIDQSQMRIQHAFTMVQP